MHSVKRYIVALLALSVCLTGYLTSRAHLQAHSAQSVPFEQRDAYPYPSARVFEALSLNYGSFAASLHWVSALIYFGDWKYTKTDALPRHLHDYAVTISQLDPRFYKVYEWFNATYISSRLPDVTYEDLQLVESFMDQGMARFPSRYELPYTTGLLSLGFSKTRTDAQRLDEYERGIEYLQKCARFKGCPDTVPFTVAYLYRQKNKFEQKLELSSPETTEANRLDQIEFNATLYAQTMDPSLRQRLAQKLESLGMTPEQLEALDQDSVAKLKRAYETRDTYFPLDLWALTVYPTPDSLSLISEDHDVR